MPSPNIDDRDIAGLLTKGWEVAQSLARSNGESAWNIRAWGVSVWCALVAYAYTSGKKEIFVVAVVLLVVVFLIELGIRQVQYKFIEKSIQIEKSINQILLGAEPIPPEGGISTNIPIPSIRDMVALLTIRRWLIWLPYGLLLVFTLYALCLAPNSACVMG